MTGRSINNLLSKIKILLFPFRKVWMRSLLYKEIKNPPYYRDYKKQYNFYKKILRLHKDKSDLIFDVGANMGTKSQVFSKLAKMVVAFEPSPSLFLLLTDKFKNRNVHVLNLALGQESSIMELIVLRKNQAYNSLSRKHLETTVIEHKVNFDIVEKVNVNVEPLEKFIKEIGKPKYLKIDVEGYELEVIKGLKTIIPIISFEANLPAFQKETISSIRYLNNLSNNTYLFNYSIDEDLVSSVFLKPNKMIEIIEDFDHKYMEIFCLLRENS